jgi:hypothetical protein
MQNFSDVIDTAETDYHGVDDTTETVSAVAMTLRKQL